MYLRFVVAEQSQNANARLGIIHAAEYLREDGLLESYEEEQLLEIFEWFNSNIPVPEGVRTSGRRVAVSWFRESAQAAISRMWSIVAILRDHGQYVEVVSSENPGKILYEDEFQVFAVPHRDRNRSA